MYPSLTPDENFKPPPTPEELAPMNQTFSSAIDNFLHGPEQKDFLAPDYNPTPPPRDFDMDAKDE